MNQPPWTRPLDPGQQQQIHNVAVANIQNVTFNQTQIIQITVDEIKTRPLIDTSPYKGLKKFEERDRDKFFGRDQFLLQLAEGLTQAPLTLLLGASGSGKSSVVRAGLLPWLARQWGSQLTALTFTPDLNPFESLYASLLGQYSQSEAKLALASQPHTLTTVVKQLKPPDRYWVIFIDQFEELLVRSLPEQRNRFITALVQLIRRRDDTVKIVATMRADFIHQLSPYPDLVQATHKHRPLIAEMFQDELRQAIEQPAAQHGVVFETGLVEAAIKDVQGQAGYLPLLQYSLNLLWETEFQTNQLKERTLHLRTYRQLGGVRGALQQHVDRFYRALSPAEQLATQRIFLKLVGIGSDEALGQDWTPIRRRALRSEFDSTLEQPILAKLIDEKLLVSNLELPAQEPSLHPHSPGNNALQDKATIELAHEILLTSWPTLKTWIQDNRSAIALRNRLNSDIARWQGSKPDDELWSGSKLEQVLELQHDDTFNQVLGGFSQTATAFIQASLSLRDRARQRQLEQERKLRKASQRSFVALLTTVVIIIGAGAVTLWQQWQQQRRLRRTQAVIVQKGGRDLIVGLQELQQEGDRLRKQQNLEALDYYRTILKNIPLLKEQIKRDKEQKDPSFSSFLPGDLDRVNTLAQNAEASLVTMIQHYHLPQLEEYLQQGRFGDLLKNEDDPSELTDFDLQYEPDTALQLTYQILMMDFGAGADANRNGLVESEAEASMMPCETLKTIQELWRQYTDNQCDWVGDDYFVDTDCTLLDGESLGGKVFDYSTIGSAIVPRLRHCQLVPPHLQARVSPQRSENAEPVFFSRQAEY